MLKKWGEQIIDSSPKKLPARYVVAVGLRIALDFLSNFLCFHDASAQLMGLLVSKKRVTGFTMGWMDGD